VLERVTVTPHTRLETARQLDLGALAEDLLFYGQVNLIANNAVLEQLLQDVEVDDLFFLLTEDLLSITYVPGGAGIRTEDTDRPSERHTPITYSLPTWSFYDFASKTLEERIGKAGRARRLTRGLAHWVREMDPPAGIKEAAQQDFESPESLNELIPIVIRYHAPTYTLPSDFRLDLVEMSDGLWSVATNPALDELRRRTSEVALAPDVRLNPAFLLSEVVGLREALAYATMYDSDFSTDALRTQLIQVKLSSVLQRYRESEADRAHFESHVLSGHSLRETINAGQRHFSDFVALLKEATSFKEWLSVQGSDLSLVEAYYAEIAGRSWLGSLPGKSLRWIIGAGLSAGLTLGGAPGPLAIAVGAGASAAGRDHGILPRLDH